MTEPIRTPQDLLERYYRAERGVIAERSGSIEEDTIALERHVVRYARTHGLDSSFLEDSRYFEVVQATPEDLALTMRSVFGNGDWPHADVTEVGLYPKLAGFHVGVTGRKFYVTVKDITPEEEA